MTVEVAPVHVRWLPDDDREALRSREVAFLLGLPARTSIWLQSRDAPPAASSPDSVALQRRRLVISCDAQAFGVDNVSRLGIPARPAKRPEAPLTGRYLDHATFIEAGGHRLSFLQLVGWPPELYPGVLHQLITFAPPIDVLVHLDPVPKAVAIRIVRQRMRAFRVHRTEDPKWDVTADDNEHLLTELLAGGNRLFRVGIVFAVGHCEIPERLRQFRMVAAREGLRVASMPFMQSPCALLFTPDPPTSPPLTRLLDAQSISHLGMLEWPTDEPSAASPPIGMDPEQLSLVHIERTQHVNPSGFILGAPGSGKSTFAKLDVLHAVAGTRARAVIFDPEGEYSLLVQHLQGRVVRLGDAVDLLNPLALFAPGDLEGKLLRIPHIVAGRLGHGAVHRLRQVLGRAYRTFQDLCLTHVERLLAPDDPLRDELWPLTQGPLRGLGQGRWVLPASSTISFDLSGFSSDAVATAVPYLLELVLTWSRALTRDGPLLVTLDEVHLFLRDPFVRSELLSLMKRARKSGVVLTGITQNVADFFLTEEGALMLSNAGLVILFRQSPEDLRLVSDRFRLPQSGRNWLSVAQPGEGLVVDEQIRPLRVLQTDVERALTDTTPLAFRRRASR